MGLEFHRPHFANITIIHNGRVKNNEKFSDETGDNKLCQEINTVFIELHLLI